MERTLEDLRERLSRAVKDPMQVIEIAVAALGTPTQAYNLVLGSTGDKQLAQDWRGILLLNRDQEKYRTSLREALASLFSREEQGNLTEIEKDGAEMTVETKGGAESRTKIDLLNAMARDYLTEWKDKLPSSPITNKELKHILRANTGVSPEMKLAYASRDFIENFEFRSSVVDLLYDELQIVLESARLFSAPSYQRLYLMECSFRARFEGWGRTYGYLVVFPILREARIHILARRQDWPDAADYQVQLRVGSLTQIKKYEGSAARHTNHAIILESQDHDTSLVLCKASADLGHVTIQTICSDDPRLLMP